MNTISLRFLLLLLCITCTGAVDAQYPDEESHSVKQVKEKPKKSKTEQQVSLSANDSNAPLHLLRPDYFFNYGVQDAKSIRETAGRVLTYLDAVTPAGVVNSDDKNEIIDYQYIDSKSRLMKGDFRLTSYEWGVTYSGMLRMAKITGDDRYSKYVSTRLDFLARVAPYFEKILQATGKTDPLMTQVLKPHALDDAGAMCAAMIKASLADRSLDVGGLIENYINYIQYHEYRLKDGIFARNRPHRNTVWLDDMYMAIPALAWMGKYSGNSKYFDEAAKQVLLFKERMFIPEMNLFRHGWVEAMDEHPVFFWGRANGWAMLTLCEVLDALPPSNDYYPAILDLLQQHIRGVAQWQSGQGLWHQLLNRNDSYLETSASAIFVYCLAHAINQGWIDAGVYGPVVSAGWAAVAQKVNAQGQVEGTCVGTGMGFDPAFYYHRPVSVFAAHGYGPVLLAAAEMIELSENYFPKVNDSAVQFYNEPVQDSRPIFSIQDASRMPFVAGSSRKNGNPVVFIIGDSTGKTGSGKGEQGMWGWGSFLECFFDTSRISIENHALGGRSSRTFITEGLWDKVLKGFKAGDYLLVQFGHNDGGPLNTGRARASLKGTGGESETVIMERHGGPEEVFTFGHYLRTYVRQAKAQGGHVIVMSHTPGNRWNQGKVLRCDQTYGKWSEQVANEEDVAYIDLNNLAALKYEALGPEVTKDYFIDNVHTSAKGAVLHAKTVVEGVLELQNCNLAQYIDQSALSKTIQVADKPLFRDPVFDGAADPVVIWNRDEQRWFMFYTNRRATLESGQGVEWVHGTRIGIAESVDGGASWSYRGEANIDYGTDSATFWAPEVIEHNGLYHMFLTVVPGIYSDWKHPRSIVHFTSTDLINWTSPEPLKLASDKVIDACVVKDPDGLWRFYYNNERDAKSIYYAVSSDLNTWTDKGKAVGDRPGEGPKVFWWKDQYFMMVDNWDGLAVYTSKDLETWKRQKKNILKKAGSGPDDQTRGLHADVVVNNDRAFIFYFTHPGRKGEVLSEDNYETRRSVIQVAELEYVNGEIVCKRDLPVFINLVP